MLLFISSCRRGSCLHDSNETAAFWLGLSRFNEPGNVNVNRVFYVCLPQRGLRVNRGDLFTVLNKLEKRDVIVINSHFMTDSKSLCNDKKLKVSVDHDNNRTACELLELCLFQLCGWEVKIFGIYGKQILLQQPPQEILSAEYPEQLW